MTTDQAPEKVEDTSTPRPFTFVLDPTEDQIVALYRHCGTGRFAYNHMLGLIKANMDQRNAEATYGLSGDELTPYVEWSYYGLRKEWNRRKHDVAPWYGAVSKEAASSGLTDLANGLKNWKDSKDGNRKGARMGFPRFQNRNRKMSMTFTTGVMRLAEDRHHVVLPRLGSIHTMESTRRLARLVESGRARITRATISFKRGRWQVTLLARVEKKQEPVHPNPGSVVGVDVGVKDWVVAATPDGEEVLRVPVPPEIKELEDKKAELQNRHRNKVSPDHREGRRGSNRWRAAQDQINKIDHRIAAIREDILHKVTTELSRSYETIVVETLSVKAMMTRGGAYKRGLNRGIARAAMSQVRTMSRYKTLREGGHLLEVGRFYPSSKTCSSCGVVKTKLTLAERTFVCDACGVVMDRDLNAAINLAKIGESSAWSTRVGATDSSVAIGRGDPRKSRLFREVAAGSSGGRHPGQSDHVTVGASASGDRVDGALVGSVPEASIS